MLLQVQGRRYRRAARRRAGPDACAPRPAAGRPAAPRERERGCSLADARGYVEEKGVSVPVGERGLEQPLGLVLLGNAGEGAVSDLRSLISSAIVSAAVPSTMTYRSGNSAAISR